MRTFSKTAVILLGSGLLLSAVAAPAMAVPAGSTSSSSELNATVIGGSITATTFGAILPAVTLNGTDKTTSATTAAWTLTDARGTGTPWSLTAIATDFTSAHGDTDLTDRTITAAHLAINLTTITALGTSDSAPTATSVPALSSTDQSTLVASASKKGSYSVLAPNYTLSVPANAFRSNFVTGTSGTQNPYISTVTFTIG